MSTRPTEKPARCPNRECKGGKVSTTFFPGDHEFVCQRCYGCGMCGPRVQLNVELSDDDAIEESRRLWNLLPRDAEPAGVARGEL